MIVCLDCFKEDKAPEDKFYKLREIRYVRLSEEPLTCEICHEEKPAIENAVYKILDPYRGNPPAGWINVEEMLRAENTPYSEGNELGV